MRASEKGSIKPSADALDLMDQIEDVRQRVVKIDANVQAAVELFDEMAPPSRKSPDGRLDYRGFQRLSCFIESAAEAVDDVLEALDAIITGHGE